MHRPLIDEVAIFHRLRLHASLVVVAVTQQFAGHHQKGRNAEANDEQRPDHFCGGCRTKPHKNVYAIVPRQWQVVHAHSMWPRDRSKQTRLLGLCNVFFSLFLRYSFSITACTVRRLVKGTRKIKENHRISLNFYRKQTDFY